MHLLVCTSSQAMPRSCISVAPNCWKGNLWPCCPYFMCSIMFIGWQSWRSYYVRCTVDVVMGGLTWFRMLRIFSKCVKLRICMTNLWRFSMVKILLPDIFRISSPRLKIFITWSCKSVALHVWRILSTCKIMLVLPSQRRQCIQYKEIECYQEMLGFASELKKKKGKIFVSRFRS